VVREYVVEDPTHPCGLPIAADDIGYGFAAGMHVRQALGIVCPFGHEVAGDDRQTDDQTSCE